MSVPDFFFFGSAQDVERGFEAIDSNPLFPHSISDPTQARRSVQSPIWFQRWCVSDALFLPTFRTERSRQVALACLPRSGFFGQLSFMPAAPAGQATPLPRPIPRFRDPENVQCEPGELAIIGIFWATC